MGQTVSTGADNDELIDNLVEADYIKTIKIQRIFRAVDRASYFLEGQKESAYRDSAWRAGNLHLSAPCVYSGVMESLKLRRGLSFLNLGSGSGYLSTMAGLILGPYGINHGVEIHNDVIDYAYEKLDEFIKQSDAVDEYDFCEPTFFNGNCLKIDNMQLYDRVYCGAACPLEYETYMKHLIKVDGVLIMPMNNRLLKITRTGISTWEHATIFNLSFAPLMSPSETGTTELVKLLEFSPPSLQVLCRSKIRALLRSHIDREHPDLQKSKVERCTKFSPRRYSQTSIPLIDVTDISEPENEYDDFVEFRNPRAKITIRGLPPQASAFIRSFVRVGRDFQEAGPSNTSRQTNKVKNANEKTQKQENQSKPLDLSSTDSESDASSLDSSDEKNESEDCTLSRNEHSFPKSLPRKSCLKSSKKKKLPPKKESSKKRQLSDSESGISSRKKRVKLYPRRYILRNRVTSFVCRRLPSSDFATTSQKKLPKKAKPSKENTLNYQKLMAEKIIALPLPPRIQMYINYRRDYVYN